MAVIVEIRSKGGQLLDRVRNESESISVGRAFDNDVIVDDAFVCPYHLKLVPCASGWQVYDLDSLNGFQIKSKGRRVVSGVVQQGDKLIIGQLVLSVYRDSYQVAPAVPSHSSELMLSGFGKWYAWPVWLSAALGVAVGFGYLNLAAEVKSGILFSGAVTELSILLVISALWALASRIFRHQAKFLSYLGLWAAFTLLSRFAEWGVELAAYNAGSRLLGLVLQNIAEVILLSAVIWGSLSLATNLRARGRLGAAVAVSVTFMALQVLPTFQLDPLFSPKPGYQGGVELPALLVVTPLTEDEFMLSIDTILDEAVAIKDDVDK